MGEAVKEIGSILELVSMSKYIEEKTSTRYKDTTQVSLDDFYDDKAFDYSCKFPSFLWHEHYLLKLLRSIYVINICLLY
ncbi:hypothetical protein R3W88_003862 [Solanum pinnatisectum]|uniref:Uncharacterized protein n=1 Tax=Solanum pinnatisectum TaxID=50273 RepID=A0AAV9MTD6_9SOLN|nr:hypothetical protein R3W88_003862 [Solanum pinnatisectum]